MESSSGAIRWFTQDGFSCWKPDDWKNLDVLTRAYTSVDIPPDLEVEEAVDNVNRNIERYSESLSYSLVDLIRDIKSYTSHQGNDCYFRQFLLDVMLPEYRPRIRRLFIFPITMAFAKSYGHKGNILTTMSTGSNAVTYSRKFFEALPVFQGSHNDLRNLEEAYEFEKFSNIFNCYIKRIDEIIEYQPSRQAEEVWKIAQCEKLLGFVIKRLENLFSHRIWNLTNKEESSTTNESRIDGEMTREFYKVFELISQLFMINEDQYYLNWSSINAVDLEKSLSVQRSRIINNKEILRGSFLIPDSKVIMDAHASNSIFGSKPGTSVLLREIPNSRKPLNPEVLEIALTVCPVEVKKQVVNEKSVSLTDEETDTTTSFNFHQGFTKEEIIDKKPFLSILQQNIRYMIGSEELQSNFSIIMFVYHKKIHIGILEIDLGQIEFENHPEDQDVLVVVDLETSTRSIKRGSENTEEIKEKILPVKLKVFSLSTCDSSTTRPDGRTVVPRINRALQHMILLNDWAISEMRNLKSLKMLRMKMLALREAFTIPETDTSTKENEDEEQDLQSNIPGSNDDTDEGDDDLSDVPMKDSNDTRSQSESEYQRSNVGSSNISVTFTGIPSPSIENLENLTLMFRDASEGPLDYSKTVCWVTNSSNEVIETTLRNISIKKKFDIEVLPENIANVISIAKSSFINGMIYQRSTFKTKDEYLTFRNEVQNKWDSEYFIIKYYNFSSFFKRTIESYGNEYGQEEFDEVRKSIFEKNFEREIDCLKLIDDYNVSLLTKQDNCSTDITIEAPKFYCQGANSRIRYGRWNEEEEMAFFMIMEKICSEENESWDKCLPLRPEVVQDACDQLDVLKSVGFCHGDIALRNLKYLKDKQRVCFLDFGNAIRLTGLSQQIIDEVVEYDKRILRGLLGGVAR